MWDSVVLFSLRGRVRTPSLCWYLYLGPLNLLTVLGELLGIESFPTCTIGLFLVISGA